MNWYEYPILQENDYAESWKGPGTDTPHFAADVQTPQGTPVVSLFSGTVKDASFQPWGGQVFVETTFQQPGFNPDVEWYVYHLDKINVKQGQQVNVGDTIGISGGEPPITDPRYSTGPHTHTGIQDPHYSGHTRDYPNYPVSSGWATIPPEGGQPQHNITYGPDVTPVLNNSALYGLTSDPGTALKNAADKISSSWFPNWFKSILQSMGITDMSDLAYRALFIGVGILLIIVGIVMLAKSVVSHTVSGAIQGG